MTVHSIHNSFWLRGEPLERRYEKLTGPHQTEVLVIGAGITGLSVALELASRGRRVTVCEAEAVGAGTTGASSGHLDAHPEIGPSQLLNQLGEEKAREFTAARLRAIRTIAARAGDRADFVSVPGYQYSESAGDADSLRREFEAAQQIGLAPTWFDKVPVARASCGYRMDGMGRMDCMRYLRRLCELVVEMGVKIFEETLVATPSGNHPRSLSAGDGEIQFEHVISAAHCNYTTSMRLYFQTPPYLSYVLVARVKDPPPDGLFWDNSKPYYYIRRTGEPAENLVMIGGCDHRNGMGDPLEASKNLETWVRERFDVEEVFSHWSGELFEPVDGLPLIGRVPGTKNIWVITGLSGVGLTRGTAAGEMIADLIEGEDVPLEAALSPSRFGLSGVTNLVSEHISTTANYAEHVLPAESLVPENLSPGEGAVGKIGGKHVAVCRDRLGNLHCHSPSCSHQGGVVHWNEVEQTWDCPVHGGRFAANGERIYGPPESPLKEVPDVRQEPMDSDFSPSA